MVAMLLAAIVALVGRRTVPLRGESTSIPVWSNNSSSLAVSEKRELLTLTNSFQASFYKSLTPYEVGLLCFSTCDLLKH